MMHSLAVPERFRREMGCTDADLRRWLPAALGEASLRWQHDGVEAAWPGGTLALRWQAMPPRRIALVRLPRLEVDFAFAGFDAETRAAVMQRFDLYTHRGGG